MNYRYLIGAAVLILLPIFLSPNIFGNQPDAVADESYFLTSALQSLQKHTLPGWEFSTSGAYYGGVQAYVDTIVIAPVVLAEVVFQHSLSSAQSWVALNTGNLLHILRLVNGLLFLATLAMLAYWLLGRGIEKQLTFQLLLLLFLILGNPLVSMLAHTAKVWVLYMCIELIAGTLILVQEHYRERGEVFISTPYYVAALLWLVVLAFFQTFVGIISTGLWLLYAWFLGHFKVRDAFAHVRRYWYAFLLVASTQISFLWRAFIAREHGSSLLDYGGFTGEHTTLDWPHRFLAPLHDAIFSQPFILLYILCAAPLLIPSYRRLLGRPVRYFIVAVAHPIIVYLFYYPLLGFDTATRYAVILSLACSFSIAMLTPRGLVRSGALAATGALALLVLAHATALYWSPSYQADLIAELTERYNDPSNVFLIDPSAIELQLPVNATTLEHLDDAGKAMSRNAYLLSHLSEVPSSFKPLVLYARTKDEYLSYAKTETNETHTYRIYLPPNTGSSAEPSALPEFFATKKLGFPYVVELLRP